MSEEPPLHRVLLEDLRSGVRQTLARDLRDLYLFYLDEERRTRLASMGRVRRFFVLLAWLLRSLLRKLLPARRLMLFAALVLGFAGEPTFRSGGMVLQIDFRFWGFLLLLIVLMLELKDKLLARDEIEVARGVQVALLPRETPRCPGWSLWSVTLPANDVGGDLVDYIELPGGRLAAALGDVAGKGLGAALLMAKLQATLRAVAPDCASLDELGSRLNAILHRDGLDNRFATLFYIELAPGSGGLRYLNAGHNPPYLVRSLTVEALRPSSLPLGAFPSGTFAEGHAEMGTGDLLFVYSDGLTEARNERDEEFGQERLEALLPRLRDLDPAEAGRHVLDEFGRFVGNERRHDDLSLLLVRKGDR